MAEWWEELLPQDDGPVARNGVLMTLYGQLGEEMGERIAPYYEEAMGPHWRKLIVNHLGKPANPVDAQWIINEILEGGPKPANLAFPSGKGLYLRLEEVRTLRNDLAHFILYSPTFDELLQHLVPMHQVGTLTEMRFGTLCARMRERIKAIQSGEYRRMSPIASSLKEELAAARAAYNEQLARNAELEAELEAAEDLLAGAATKADVDKVAALQERNAQAEMRLLVMQQRLDDLELALAPDEDPWCEVRPGQPWPDAVPARQVVMTVLGHDLFDAMLGREVAVEFGGDEARAAVKEWKRMVPAGTTVYLSTQGQAVAYVGGRPVYLGCLAVRAEEVRSTRASQGAADLLARPYQLKLNGDIFDMRSGACLQDVRPESADAVGRRLLTVAQHSGRLKVSRSGEVAVLVDDQWVLAGEVTAEEWFPGHLDGDPGVP